MKDFPGNIHTSPFESFKKQDKSPPKKSNHPPPKNSIKDNNNINDDANNNNNIKKQSDTNKNNNNTIKNNMYILKKTQNMIDPESIPHPSEFEDYYLNTEKQNIYYSTVGNHPPHSISKYSVIETENSSCRLIRSSLVRFPTNQNLLSKTGILFGLYCQPFADFNENEKKIPQVDGSKGIFRCKNCNSYVNNKCTLTFNNNNGQRILICNICKNENIVSDSEMFNNEENIELIYPTIDFIPPETVTSKIKKFIPHYCIMIDICKVSYELGFPNYILNSFLSNLNSFNNAENSYICFATYDIKGIQFYTLNKSQEINVIFMNDIDSPFSPVSPKYLYFNVKTQQEEINILIEKINIYISKRVEIIKSHNINIGGSAIYAAIESLLEYGGRAMIFSCSSNKLGYGVSSLNNDNLNVGINILKTTNIVEKKNRPEEEKKLLNSENEYKLFSEQNKDFYNIIEKCNKNRITVDQFIFGEIDYDLNKLDQISNCTGGGIYHYNFNLKNINQNNSQINLNYYYERLFYDITRIISRNNIYGINAVLRNTIGIEILEILGGMYNIVSTNTSFFNIGGFDPDSSFIYNLRIDDYFKNEQKIDFQLAVLYTNNYSQNFLRVINYSIIASDSIEKIFSYADIDVIVKLYICKELNFLNKKECVKIEEDMDNKIIETFAAYKKLTNQHLSPQLILPAQLKFLPVYVNSFCKKIYFKKFKNLESITTILALKHFFNRASLYAILLYLYPKLYKIKLDAAYLSRKMRLSGENIKADRMYISTNGLFVDIYIFNYLEEKYYFTLFNHYNFNDCIQDIENCQALNEEELSKDEIGQSILEFIEDKKKANTGFYSPLRIFFVTKVNAMNFEELKNLLVEDELNMVRSYCYELVYIHNGIENKFK
jgi:hypothetical protein